MADFSQEGAQKLFPKIHWKIFFLIERKKFNKKKEGKKSEQENNKEKIIK